MRFTLPQLESRIKHLQDYLGPRVNYTSDTIPSEQPERWLLEYLDILKRRRYLRMKGVKRDKHSLKLSTSKKKIEGDAYK